MKKVFITGATGFIGEQLALRLAADGAQVQALVRNPEKGRRLEHPNIRLIEGDLDDIQALKHGMYGCDQVYHLAGLVQVWHKDPEMFTKVNVRGTRRVMHAAEQAGVKQFLFTSTAGTLGPARKGTEVNEGSTPSKSPETEYERTKAEAERLVMALPVGEMKAVIVNPTRVFGPGQFSVSNAVTKLIDKYRRGKWHFVPGSGRQSGNYVFIDDVVEGHILAQEKGRHGEQYILGGENASYREFFNTVGECLGKRYRLFGMPVAIMMLVARLQMLGTRFGRSPLISPAFVRKYHHHWSLDISKARQELGYQPRSLRDGISDSLAWLENRTTS